MVKSKAERRKGELYVYLGGVLWAFFPIITVLSYAKLPSIVSLAWTTLFSAVFFFFAILFRNKWHEMHNWLLWKYTFSIVFFIGIMFYGLYFIGLTKTTAGNASIISRFDVFTSFLLFSVIKKEPFSFEHIVGSMLMIISAIVVLAPGITHFNGGDLFILAATCFTPYGNYFQQKARKIASSEMIMFLRSVVSTPFLFLLAFAFGQHASFESVRASLLFLLINGFLLFGLSKLFWIEAIHRISVTKGSALSNMNPLLTLLFAWIILKQTPSIWQLASLIPLVLGILFLTDQITIKKRPPKTFKTYLENLHE